VCDLHALSENNASNHRQWLRSSRDHVAATVIASWWKQCKRRIVWKAALGIANSSQTRALRVTRASRHRTRLESDLRSVHGTPTRPAANDGDDVDAKSVASPPPDCVVNPLLGAANSQL
jgi:hypothetical protein